MSRKLLIISILAAVLMILLPISSVIGTNVIRENTGKRVADSPLFASRIRSFTKQNTKEIKTNFLGKGFTYNIFLTKRSSLDGWVDKAIKLVNARPDLLSSILDKIETVPHMSDILEEYDISIIDFKDHINMIKNDPILLEKEIDAIVQTAGTGLSAPINDPEPLGFSGQMGCFIAFLVILPIIIMIGTMIATFTIITCLNINGCFQTIMQNVLEGFAQGLTQPDF